MSVVYVPKVSIRGISCLEVYVEKSNNIRHTSQYVH